MRLEELLALPDYRRARPEVLAPGDDRPVGWVHSSEIYEIAPLLEGGEVLLTTGLGLVGASDHELATYAEGIDRAGAVAIVLELGRSFPEAPDALVGACRSTGVALVALRSVVPFVVLARTANERLLDHEATSLRRTERLVGRLTAALLDGGDVEGIVAAMAELIGTPVRLTAADGRTIVAAGGSAAPGATVRTAPIELHGAPWGELVVEGTDEVVELLEHAAPVVRLALLQSAEARGGRRAAARALLRDLSGGRFGDASEVELRAASLGVRTDVPVRAIGIQPMPAVAPARLLGAVEAVLRERGATPLVAEVDGAVVAACGETGLDRAAGSVLVDALDAAIGAPGAIRHLVLGPVVPGFVELGAALAEVRRLLTLARRTDARVRVLLSTDRSLTSLLASTDDAALEAFVRRVLGPLLEHDATTGRPLLPTLVAFQDCGRSKTVTAKRLAVRRQTVDARLRRMGELLDRDLEAPEHALDLGAAVLAWRLRLSGRT